MPVMRNVRADEHQITRVEKLNVIRDKSSPRTALNECQFRRAMVMPVISLALNRPGNPAANYTHAIHAPGPTEKAECFVGSEADIFTLNGHR